MLDIGCPIILEDISVSASLSANLSISLIMDACIDSKIQTKFFLIHTEISFMQ